MGAGLCTCQGVMSGVSNIQAVLCRLEIQREVAVIFQLRSWEALICRYSEHLQTDHSSRLQKGKRSLEKGLWRQY